MEALEAWWTRCLEEIPPTARGLWFGLVQLEAQDGPERMLYVAGCPTFDAGDEDAEWAAEHVSFPKGTDDYLPLRLVGISIGDDWARGLAATAEAVQRLRPEKSVAVDGAAVGYDDGDFVAWGMTPPSSS